jgi:hypothetical protein
MKHLSALKKSSEGGTRLNGAFTELTFRIAERVIFFLRSAYCVLLPQPPDADSNVVRRHGKVPIMVYVMVELKDHAPKK